MEKILHKFSPYFELNGRVYKAIANSNAVFDPYECPDFMAYWVTGVHPDKKEERMLVSHSSTKTWIRANDWNDIIPLTFKDVIDKMESTKSLAQQAGLSIHHGIE